MLSQTQRISFTFGVITVLLASASLVFAQSTASTTTGTSTDSVTSTTTQETATSTPVATTTAQEEDQLSSSTALTREAQVRITNLAANISNRSEAYIKRFELIMLRVESRILKMENAGYNMSDTRFYMQEARSALNDAKSEMFNIDVRVNQFVTSEDAKNKWVELRLAFTETRSHLERTKSLLVNAVDEIKLTLDEGIQPQTEEGVATTTASSTIQ